MENTREELLAAIRQELSALKTQVAQLESRLAAIESQEPVPSTDEASEIPVVIDDSMMAISLDDIMEVDLEAISSDLPADLEAFGAELDKMLGEPSAEYSAAPAEDGAPAQEQVEEPAEEVAEEDVDDLPFDMPAEEEMPAVEEETVDAEEETADAEPVEEVTAEIEPEVESEPEVASEPVVEPEPAVEPEPVEDLPEDDEPSFMDIFGMAQSDEGTLNAKHRAGKKKAVMDVMATKEAWRNDMPGSPVKDIRSAISLNDRILFIRTLFEEDPALFQDTIAEVNALETLDEAVEYLKEHNPSWDFDSDTVYRFMMAVRRKIR